MYQHGPNMPDILVWKNEITDHRVFQHSLNAVTRTTLKRDTILNKQCCLEKLKAISYGLTQMETKLLWSELKETWCPPEEAAQCLQACKDWEEPEMPPCLTSHGSLFQKRQLGNHIEYLGVGSTGEMLQVWAGCPMSWPLSSHLCTHVEGIS